MIVEFLEEAEAELFDAVLWYESKEIGLGDVSSLSLSVINNTGVSFK